VSITNTKKFKRSIDASTISLSWVKELEKESLTPTATRLKPINSTTEILQLLELKSMILKEEELLMSQALQLWIRTLKPNFILKEPSSVVSSMSLKPSELKITIELTRVSKSLSNVRPSRQRFVPKKVKLGSYHKRFKRSYLQISHLRETLRLLKPC
jgi:hypothetical protein